jgi:hypothetical protein
VLPLLRRCADQALILRDSSLAVVAKQLGPWLESLKPVLIEPELKWFLQTYSRLVEMSSGEGVSKDGGGVKEAPGGSITINEGGGLKKTTTGASQPSAGVGGNAALWNSVRRMCAYNFPVLLF